MTSNASVVTPDTTDANLNEKDDGSLLSESLNNQDVVVALDSIHDCTRHKSKERVPSSLTHVNRFFQKHFVPIDSEIKLLIVNKSLMNFLKKRVLNY